MKAPTSLSDFLPTQQVLSGGIGAVVLFLALTVAKVYWGIDLGPAADTAIEGVGVTLVAHFTPVSAVDAVKVINDDIALAGTFLGKLTSKSDSNNPMTPTATEIAKAAK